MFLHENFWKRYAMMEWLLIETTAESVVSVLNFVALIYLLIRMRTTKMIHKNLRALLCWIIRVIYDATIYIFALSMLFMAVERIVATLAIRNYEQHESNIIALSLVIPQWILSVSAAIIVVISDIHTFTPQQDHSCSSIYYHPALLSGIFLGGVIGFFSFAVVLFALYQYNSKGYTKPRMRSLNIRYQMAENITTLRFLVPIVASFGALFAASFIIVLYIASNVKANTQTTPTLIREFFVYEQLYNLLGVTFTLLFITFCIFLHTPLRKTLEKDFGFSKRRENNYLAGSCQDTKLMRQLSCQKEANIHFANLQADWSQKGR
uniref:G_PROTEIN_RECEP_F1_2 domain-containing protein n=1 Tax=Syphacia muris TaxID=451379 RepID=A0A158R5H9_9BILA